MIDEKPRVAITTRQRSKLQEITTPWGRLVGVKADRITKTILADGQYEWAETAIVAQLLRSGATAIDVGANIGYYTTLFRRLVGPQGAVHAFEANPFTATLLKLGIEKNGWTDIAVNAMAAGESVGTLSVKAMDLNEALVDDTLNLGGWSLREAREGDWHIPVVPLDQYVRDNHIEKVHFLKVDVEGFEPKVLQGGEHVVRKLRPYMMLEMRASETADRLGCEQMVERLRHDDFVCCRIVKRPFPHFRPLNRDDLEGGSFHFNMLAMPSARYRAFLASVSGRVPDLQA